MLLEWDVLKNSFWCITWKAHSNRCTRSAYCHVLSPEKVKTLG